ncbi:MAG TPA: hypothetical protein PKZ58_01785, partial [Bacillota bacterium]|nr:hypothetical protein [Bacillota bacterium]
MISNEVKAPWLSCYGDVPPTLSYPEGTMWDAVEEIVRARMGDAAELSVPLDVQIGRGENWDVAGH